MTRNLILVLSAFTALIALGALAHDMLSPSASGGAGLQMLGVLVVGSLCWLRWRRQWQNVFLVPALVVGAVMLVLFALLGVSGAARFSSLESVGGSSRGVLDLLLVVQGTLMLFLIWKERFRTDGGNPPDMGQDPDVKE